ECVVDVPLADAAARVGTEVRRCGPPLVERLRVGVVGLADVEDWLPLLELDLYQLDGLERGRLVLRCDDGDRLTLVTDVVGGEQWLVSGDAERLEVAVAVSRDVLGRDHGVDTRMLLGLARVEAFDSGVRVR